MNVKPKFAAAAASSAMASGQMERECFTMTSSMMTRWISGMIAVMTVASSAPLRDRMKFRRYRQQ